MASKKSLLHISHDQEILMLWLVLVEEGIYNSQGTVKDLRGKPQNDTRMQKTERTGLERLPLFLKICAC